MKKKLNYQLKSFKWAFQGIKIFFKEETKAWIHLMAGILAIFLGIVFQLNILEWAIVSMAIGIVFICEILNTVLEVISDTLPDKFDSIRGKSKDMAAGAVLLSAAIAVIIACLIFLPKIIMMIKSW